MEGVCGSPRRIFQRRGGGGFPRPLWAPGETSRDAREAARLVSAREKRSFSAFSGRFSAPGPRGSATGGPRHAGRTRLSVPDPTRPATALCDPPFRSYGRLTENSQPTSSPAHAKSMGISWTPTGGPAGVREPHPGSSNLRRGPGTPKIGLRSSYIRSGASYSQKGHFFKSRRGEGDSAPGLLGEGT